MVLRLPHTEGGFGVTFNSDITKNASSYTVTSRFVALAWCLYPGTEGFVVARGRPQGLILMVLAPVSPPP